MNSTSKTIVIFSAALITLLQNCAFGCKILKTGANDEKVCVCDEKYCDTVPQPKKVPKTSYLLFTSNKNGLRFQKSVGNFKNNSSPTKNRQNIHVNPKKKLQQIIGWGGSFTDATGINIKTLDEKVQDMLLKSYFSEDGLEYTLCRVPIGCTDFSTRYYTYDDSKKDDPNLENFSLAPEDFQYKIPFMKKALKLNKNLKFFGSPWAAPKWMKTNNAYAGFGFMKKKYYQAWAEYFVKFLKAYKEHGLDFWGLTTQNEPSMAFLLIKDLPTVGWTTFEGNKWLRDHLGPTLKKSIFNKTRVIILDDQKLLLPWAVNAVLEDKEVRKYVDGIGIHWYFGLLTPCKALTRTHQNWPEQFLLSTEACSGFQKSTGVFLGSWERGEAYSTDIIEDMNCFVSGWVDWNLVLDMKGGPSAINNTVDAPIIVNTETGEFYKQPMYYHMGHFSKFVPPGSIRIEISENLGNNLMTTGFQRPDNGTVVVILNKGNTTEVIEVFDDNRGLITLQASERSITTLLYW